jgi:hypothetical protein
VKSHLITASLLIAAIPLYLAGFAGAGVLFLVAGISLEIWFWIRIFRRKRNPA